jgi:subtilisin family serine protease
MRVILNMPIIYYGFLSLLAAIGGSDALGADRDPARKNQLPLPIIDVQAWARDPELTLPSNQTTLRVLAHQAHQGPNPLTYQWVKMGGPPSGTVTFAPNGDGYSDRTTATFSANVAGTYTLRAIITNGLTETISEVDVTIEPGSDRTQRPSGHKLGDNSDQSPARYRAERIGKRVVHSRADRVIVRMDVDTGPGNRGRHGLSTQSRTIMELLGARVSKTWFQGRLGLVELGPDIDPSVLNRLRALPEFRYVVADDHSISLADYVPNDPKFGSQWGLENSADVDINATLAWDQTTGSSGTLVAVLDTGIDYTHPDLYLAIAINNYEIPESIFAQLVDTNATGSIDFYDLNSLDANGDIVLDEFGAKFNQGLVTDVNGNGYIDAGDLQTPNWSDGVDDDGNGYVDDLTGWDHLSADNDVLDTHGHGTHVAGIIAARGDNGVGVAGVNWRAQILPVRFQNGDGGQISDVIQSIEYSVAMGANVINASWGTFIDHPALKDAIQFAGDGGAVFVAAAGNHANNIDDPAVAYYPAAYTDLSNLIGVASVSSDGNLSSFSNYGVNSVDLAAPGASVLSTGLGGAYILWSGTSMSTPHVAGVVSLVAGLFPDESPDWLVNHVLATVKPLPDLANKTWTGGMVDAFLAVDTPSIAGPRIVMATPIGDVLGPVDRVVLTFDSAIAAATFTTSDIDISGPGAPIIPTSVNRLSDFVFEVVFPAQATVGAYTVQVGPDVEDSLGRVMDQDRDGNAGEPLDDQFNTTFRLVAAPQAWIIDDGDTGYSTSGSWTTYTGVGTEGDFAYKAVGSGAATASWTQGGLAPGEYRVSVTWEAYTNRAVDAPYTVLDGAFELGTVIVDQRQAPVGFVADGVSWQDLGFYQLNGDTLVVRLSDAANPSGSYVIADAVRVERVGP